MQTNVNDIFNGKYLKIFYENIDGISDHNIRDLAESSSTADYEIIALTETWLNQSVKKEILDDRYTVYRKDRETIAISQTATCGGGVLIAVRSTIKCELYSNDKMEDLEALPRKNWRFIYVDSTCSALRATSTMTVHVCAPQ